MFTALNYPVNLLALARNQSLLKPLAIAYYLTTRCNLNCSYCEDFGARRNAHAAPPLPLEEALQILRVARTGSAHLILTGGEPLLAPHIISLVQQAHANLRYRSITLLTNGVLLPEKENLLYYLKRLVISFDTPLVERWSKLLNVSEQAVENILQNIRKYAAQQANFGYKLILNAVITPENLQDIPAMLLFARQHGAYISFSPQAVHNWPNYDVVMAAEYKRIMDEIIACKRRGGPIAGSLRYLYTLRDLTPYTCHPTLVPRILPNGDLIYPCRPIEREGNVYGGHPVNLLNVQTWQQALTQAQNQYGAPPQFCASCFQQCYAEPSLMQANPLDYMGEWLRYPVARQAHINNYAPG